MRKLLVAAAVAALSLPGAAAFADHGEAKYCQDNNGLVHGDAERCTPRDDANCTQGGEGLVDDGDDVTITIHSADGNSQMAYVALAHGDPLDHWVCVGDGENTVVFL